MRRFTKSRKGDAESFTRLVAASEDVNVSSVPTVNGRSLTIHVQDGKATVDNAQVAHADITAAGGVIHVVDAAIRPY